MPEWDKTEELLDRKEENLVERESVISTIDDVVYLSDLYLHKNYLQYLDKMPIVPIDEKIQGIRPGNNLRMIRVEGILHDKNENLSEKVKSLFGAVQAFEAGVMLVLQAKGERVKIYIGICGMDMEHVNPAFNTFISSLKGILPGCKYYNVKMPEVNTIMEEVFAQNIVVNGTREKISVSAVSAFPGVSVENRGDVVNPYKAIEKIDVLLDGMRGRPFSMVLLAKTVSSEILTMMQHQLEMLYTQLSLYERQTISASESDTDSVNLNFSKSVASNQSYSTGLTHGVSHTHGEGTNYSEQKTDENAKRKQAGLGLLGTAVSLAIPLAGATIMGPGETLADIFGNAYGGGKFLQSMFYGSGISSAATNAGILSGKMPDVKSISEGRSEHDDYTNSESKQVTFSVGEGVTDSSGYSIGNNRTVGNTAQYTIINKHIGIILNELEREIGQIQHLKREGAFSGAAYFIAGDTETAVTAANVYRTMTETNLKDLTLSSPIYRWGNRDEVDLLVEYLSRGFHPAFILKNEPHQPYVEAAQMIGLNDIPVYFSFPQKSIPGMVVSEYAGFSRDIILQDGASSRLSEKGTVHIGYIYHLGRTEIQSPIYLSIDDLTKHLFVAGATGVGKSNFCYQLLDQLDHHEIKMLIIEPAKGEYSSMLGGRQGFHVFGADIMRSPVIRINPFAFPDGISVVQHIERLLDIFNAAWSMYDAMPAILKEAIEKIYLDKGFDLYFGQKPENTDFPCFDDLLAALPDVIQKSDYSKEVKGNYTGALVTRIKSLTNGLYRMIFGKNEIGDDVLFDQNVIVDISRIGAVETKALLMGVLTIRLSEYRMCEGRINSPLRHVTLLEEAHNLLRRTTGGNVQGMDLRGASVEMITNAIAEMRTYGEGFLIADQSPSVLDASVIRNTHTKIFFMLPDRHDRDVAGDSLALNEEQKQEIARLSPGVAAVYQNGWTSAALCKINYYSEDKAEPFVYRQLPDPDKLRELVGQAIAVLLKDLMGKDKESSISSEFIKRLDGQKYLFFDEKADEAMRVVREFESYGSFSGDIGEKRKLLSRLIPLERIIKETESREEKNVWGSTVEKQIRKYAELSEDEIVSLVQCGISWFLPRDEIGKMCAKYIGYRHFVG